MLTINYAPSALAVSDEYAEAYVLDAVKDTEAFDKTVSISTSNVIYAARALFCEGKINIGLSFEGDPLILNKDGSMPHWPTGFCDHADSWLYRLVCKQYPDNHSQSATEVL